MLTSNKTFCAFDRSQKPFGFVCVNCMLKVLLVGNNFQVIQPIIAAVKIFMVYLQAAFNWAVKSLPHHTMHSFAGVFAVAYKVNLQIVLSVFARFYGSMRSIARPSLTQLDRMGRGYASAQKLSNLLKGCTVFKHTFGFRNFSGVKSFTSGDTAHVSKVADFIQTLKIKNWFPRLHILPPFNVNRSIS